MYACSSTHTCTTQPSSAFFLHAVSCFNNHAVCYLQSKLLSYCPCMLSWSKFSWVRWSCEGKGGCCVLESRLLWIGERLPGWPPGLHLKATNPLLWIRSHRIVDSKSLPWPHNSWGGLKLCCHGTGAICYFLLCCLGIQREFKGNYIIESECIGHDYPRQNETNKNENTLYTHIHAHILKRKYIIESQRICKLILSMLQKQPHFTES